MTPATLGSRLRRSIIFYDDPLRIVPLIAG